MLRLKAERGTLLVNAAPLAFDGAVQKIAGIELDARLCRKDFHHPSTRGLIHADGAPKRAAGKVEHPVVIITLAEDQLFVLLVDSGANGCRFCKIHWSALDAPQFAGRNQNPVNRVKAVGLDHDLVIENAS